MLIAFRQRFFATELLYLRILKVKVILLGDCELPITISILACALADNRSRNEIDLLSALFTQLGDTLATIAIQNENNNSQN